MSSHSSEGSPQKSRNVDLWDGATTISIATFPITVISIVVLIATKILQDTQHNDNQHNDNQHNNIPLNGNQHSGLNCDKDDARHSA